MISDNCLHGRGLLTHSMYGVLRVHLVTVPEHEGGLPHPHLTHDYHLKHHNAV